MLITRIARHLLAILGLLVARLLHRQLQPSKPGERKLRNANRQSLLKPEDRSEAAKDNIYPLW
jgi:hypothetical protein